MRAIHQHQQEREKAVGVASSPLSGRNEHMAGFRVAAHNSDRRHESQPSSVSLVKATPARVLYTKSMPVLCEDSQKRRPKSHHVAFRPGPRTPPPCCSAGSPAASTRPSVGRSATPAVGGQGATPTHAPTTRHVPP